MKTILYISTIALALVAGWFLHLAIRGEHTANFHRKKIEQFYAHIENPDNKRTSNGFTHLSEPFDIKAHAEALVQFGEAHRQQVIIPTVPATPENTKKWMSVGSYPDVIHAEAPHYEDNGSYPVNFTIWYSPEFEEEIQALIHSFTAP